MPQYKTQVQRKHRNQQPTTTHVATQQSGSWIEEPGSWIEEPGSSMVVSRSGSSIEEPSTLR
eukprot:2599487-Lingulodinium_polyedra.AAC.1